MTDLEALKRRPRIMQLVNWPQAIAEVMLLLIGVGIALATDSWMDDKRDI